MKTTTKAKAKAKAKKPAAKTPAKDAAKAKPKAQAKHGPGVRKDGETLYWLLKSEPDAFSWADCKSRGAKGEPWTGVRNFLARNNMRAMKIGDLGFFYHSNEGLEVVGIIKVIATSHPDTSDESGSGKWDCVDVAAVCDVPKPVTLGDVKANPKLKDMSLVTSMRLSVQPVTPAEWAEVCRMGGLDPKKIGHP